MLQPVPSAAPEKKKPSSQPHPPLPTPPHSPTQAATQAIGSGRRPRARRWPRRGGRRCAAVGAKLSNQMVQARHRCEGSGGHPLSHAESAALTESCCAVRGRCRLCSPHRLRRRPRRRRRPLWTPTAKSNSHGERGGSPLIYLACIGLQSVNSVTRHDIMRDGRARNRG